MALCPGEDESQLAASEVADHALQIVDSHLFFSFGMASMEVREAVIVEEHDDGYPEEAADRRHPSIMPTASAARMQTKTFASERRWFRKWRASRRTKALNFAGPTFGVLECGSASSTSVPRSSPGRLLPLRLARGDEL